MNTITCEAVILAATAAIDGEEAVLYSERATAHLAHCENCRREVEQMRNVVNLLKSRTRRERTVDLWLEIERRLEVQTVSVPQKKWQPFLLLGVFLVAYKLFEMIPEIEFGFVLKLAPLVFVAAFFYLLRENPFKINTELALEK